MPPTIEGFCIVGQADEPLGPDQFCLEHRMIGIAPSWGYRGQKFRNGTWEPFKPKPDGYQYKPRYSTDVQKEPESVTVTCECGTTFSYVARGGTAPSYCSMACKGKAARDRQRARKRSAVTS